MTASLASAPAAAEEQLAATWSEEQLMDFIFAVGQYRLVSMALNTLGVQIDPGLRGF